MDGWTVDVNKLTVIMTLIMYTVYVHVANAWVAEWYESQIPLEIARIWMYIYTSYLFQY